MSKIVDPLLDDAANWWDYLSYEYKQLAKAIDREPCTEESDFSEALDTMEFQSFMDTAVTAAAERTADNIMWLNRLTPDAQIRELERNRNWYQYILEPSEEVELFMSVKEL